MRRMFIMLLVATAGWMPFATADARAEDDPVCDNAEIVCDMVACAGYWFFSGKDPAELVLYDDGYGSRFMGIGHAILININEGQTTGYLMWGVGTGSFCEEMVHAEYVDLVLGHVIS